MRRLPIAELLEGRTLFAISLIVGAGGGYANGFSSEGVLSFDGRYVAFTSEATNLVPEDNTDDADVFLRDRESNTTTLVSVLPPDDELLSFGAEVESISGDGRLVVFSTLRSDGEGDATRLIFVRDVLAATTTLVSVGLGGAPADDDSFSAAISSDGRLVTFGSLASNLVSGDTNDESDIFLRDLESATTMLVTVASDGGPAEFGGGRPYFGETGGPFISADGRFVTFTSGSDDFGPEDDNREDDVYLRDMQTGETSLVTVDPRAPQDTDFAAAISQEGRYVVYIRGGTYGGDVPTLDRPYRQIYMRDRVAETTTLVSVGAYRPADRPGRAGRGRSGCWLHSRCGRMLKRYGDVRPDPAKVEEYFGIYCQSYALSVERAFDERYRGARSSTAAIRRANSPFDTAER